jgi:hypothetical protein
MKNIEAMEEAARAAEASLLEQAMREDSPIGEAIAFEAARFFVAAKHGCGYERELCGQKLVPLLERYGRQIKEAELVADYLAEGAR